MTPFSSPYPVIEVYEKGLYGLATKEEKKLKKKSNGANLKVFRSRTEPQRQEEFAGQSFRNAHVEPLNEEPSRHLHNAEDLLV